MIVRAGSFSHIAVPVDLAHTEALDRVLAVAAKLAQSYACPITFISVTSSLPGPYGHNPEEFTARLRKFAEGQGGEHGIEAKSHAVIDPDPVIDVDHAIVRAVKAIQADLVVMATHRPSLTSFIWPSNGSAIAAHSDASVLLVRSDFAGTTGDAR